MADEESILEDLSPNGNVQASVMQDDRVAFFYLQGAPETEFGLKTCWVRNLSKAPPTLEVHDMRRGDAPMLPAKHCKHPRGSTPLSKARLRIVWFEEGDAAALLEDNEVLAIIPSWSGYKGFDGYARDCIGEGPLCWELARENALLTRVKQSEDYWTAWESDPDLWKRMQEEYCSAYTQQVGEYEKYYAIDGGRWPPKAMLKIVSSDAVALVTLGVALRAQPSVEMFTEQPEQLRRIELGIALTPKLADCQFQSVGGYLSGQAGCPWSRYTWIGPYHTLDCDAFGPESAFSSVLLVPSPAGAPAVKLPTFRGDPVKLLWLVPITEAERKYAMDNPKDGGQKLAKVLSSSGIGWVCSNRRSVV
jgi:hypothetical protein